VAASEPNQPCEIVRLGPLNPAGSRARRDRNATVRAKSPSDGRLQAARSAPSASRSICRQLARPRFLPTSIALVRRAFGAHGRVLSRLAREPRRVQCRGGLSRKADWARSPPRLPSVQRRVLFGNLYPATAGERARNRPARIFGTLSSFSRCRSARTCRGYGWAFVAGDRNFLSAFLELRNVSSPQVPLPAQRVAIAAYAGRGPCRREPEALQVEVRSGRPDFSAAAMAIAGRPAAFCCGSTSRSMAATRLSRCGCGAKPGCAWCRAAISRATRLMAAIPVPATSGSRGGRTRRRPRKRCIDWLVYWAEELHVGH